MISFYCKSCELDFDAESELSVFSDGQKVFKTNCPECGIKTMRFVTNPQHDPYYYLSRRVIMLREEHKKDIIQPGEHGFETYYRTEWEKIEKAAEEAELKEKRIAKERDVFLKRYGSLAKKVIDAEERIANA